MHELILHMNSYIRWIQYEFIYFFHFKYTNSYKYCWVRCTHCSDYEAQGASGNYEAWGASGDYEARGASGDYNAWGASGGKYEAWMEIFCILAAVNIFSWISRKEESRWGKSESRWGKLESRWRKRKAVEESRKPIGENQISCEENRILGEGNLNIGDSFPTCDW
jgi:hypothetical protein